MAIKMENGDYCIRPGGAVALQGAEALLADALFRLQCVRGSFPFLPTLGSRLWRLGLERPADRQALARQYCAEALEGLGVAASEIEVWEQGRALCVALVLSADGQSMNAEVIV